MTEKLTTREGLMQNYGCGFIVEDIGGRKIVGHGGGGPSSGVNSDLKLFWDGGYTVVVLSYYDAPVAQDMSSEITGFLSLQ